MSRRHDKRQLVDIDDGGSQLRILGIEREDAEFYVVLEQIVRNLTTEGAPDRDLDGRMQAAILCQHRQQVERGKFVGGDGQLALLQFAHLDQGGLRVLTEVEQFFSVLLQDASCIGKYAVARGAVKERLADFDLQFADGLADGRLSAKQLFGGA